jgi:hypothetical protein
MSKLFEFGFDTKGLVSYHNIDAAKDGVHYPKRYLPTALGNVVYPTFLTTVPFTNCNTENIIKTDANVKLVNDFRHTVASHCNFQEHADISNKSSVMQLQSDPIQRALAYIALETTVKYPAPFQSNISFKSICQKRPFIIYGSPGSVKLLKTQGFKTFDQWWDESYDSEHDHEKRLHMIFEILKYLTSLDTDSLQGICTDMTSLLDYNYQHLTSTFLQNERSRQHSILDQSFVDHD